MILVASLAVHHFVLRAVLRKDQKLIVLPCMGRQMDQNSEAHAPQHKGHRKDRKSAVDFHHLHLVLAAHWHSWVSSD